MHQRGTRQQKLQPRMNGEFRYLVNDHQAGKLRGIFGIENAVFELQIADRRERGRRCHGGPGWVGLGNGAVGLLRMRALTAEDCQEGKGKDEDSKSIHPAKYATTGLTARSWRSPALLRAGALPAAEDGNGSSPLSGFGRLPPGSQRR